MTVKYVAERHLLGEKLDLCEEDYIFYKPVNPLFFRGNCFDIFR